MSLLATRTCATCRHLTGAPPATLCLAADYLGWATQPEQPACRGRAWEARAERAVQPQPAAERAA